MKTAQVTRNYRLIFDEVLYNKIRKNCFDT
jgi:hypothetical protein